MTTKQNAIDLANTARSEAAAIANGTKRTITQIITNWNECVKQAGFMCIYDFPTTGYSRKSQIADDLIRCAGQLDNYFEPNPHAPQSVEQQAREINAALTRTLDVEEAHSEALEENYRFGWLTNRFNLFWGGCDFSTRRSMTERAHNEALVINAEMAQREMKLNAIWRGTHRDYRSSTDGVRSIMVCRGATCLVPLSELTEKEITQRSNLWK